MKIIATTGPESAGKTSLAQDLAKKLGSRWTTEYARDYLQALDRPYREEDLLHIARGQQEQIHDQVENSRNRFLVCDTDLLVVRIWSEVRYGRCHPWIREQLRKQPADLYLLCRPDIPWQFDSLRENPHDREALFAVYREVLEREGFAFHLIEGEGREKRLQKALAGVQQHFPSL